MDISELLDNLNSAQRDAVCAEDEHLLILAGAGSGKTRVLTRRIAWLIRSGAASIWSVLAVTFTNKAANEMRQRIEALLEMPVSGMWVGTFHGIAHRMLRAHFSEAKLPQSFQILDSDDQLRLVKRTLKDLEIDDKKWPARQMQWFINGEKERGVRPGNLEAVQDRNLELSVKVYHHYEMLCQRNGSVDFAELLLRCYELLRDNLAIRDHYQRRFTHLLIDEFQDTNTLQYQLIKILSGEDGKVFAVGDDDQSIYGWRGAKIENIHNYRKNFSDSRLIRLEQNYRSTGNILSAANALIANNDGRLGKELWTEAEAGDPIRLYAAYNELEEARFIVQQIKNWVDAAGRRSDCAILYRSNAQSRVLEEALLMNSIPYRVYGGMRFFERAEIKDALAYLRLIRNRDDDSSFERVINTPPRGIGAKTIDMLRHHARENEIPLWQAALQLLVQDSLTKRAATSVHLFIQLIENTAESLQGLDLDESVDAVIDCSGLKPYFKKEKGERGEARIENLQELVSAARQFEFDPDEGMDDLAAFLAHASLEAGEGQAAEGEDCVQMMTLHSAKGLEFPLVFMSGLEEGLFPHQRSVSEEGRLEEERRLCYVGMTRARQRLFLSYAEVRRLYGKEEYALPSRFVSEIPEEFLDNIRMHGSVKKVALSGQAVSSYANHQDTDILWRSGVRVRHPKFGNGTLLQQEGGGAQARVQVRFDSGESKWLMLAYARIEAL